MTDLPTPAEMLANADRLMAKASQALADAHAELWSDWPGGHEMTDVQAERRTRMVKVIGEAKVAIERGRR